jgi:branched-chain amino acid transport system substrate-binding protein
LVKHSQFAIDAINARGGVLGGRKIELVALDNKNSPQEALLVMQQIVDRGISFMIQSGGSHIAVPLAEAVDKHNSRNPQQRLVLFDEPGNYDLSQDKCNFWTFMFMVNAPEIKMEAIAADIARHPAIKRVYLINPDDTFGHLVKRFAREILARKRPDIEIVGDDLLPLGKVKDFSPYVAKINSAKADTVITANWGNDMALLVRAATDSGLKASFYTYYGFGPGAPTALAVCDRQSQSDLALAPQPTERVKSTPWPKSTNAATRSSTMRCRSRTCSRCWRQRSIGSVQPTHCE